MSILRRYHRQGNIYFITNVTYERKPILVSNLDLLLTALSRVSDKSSLNLIAWVILPDHLHLIIDPKENNISNLLQRIRLSFVSLYRKRKNLSPGRFWQNRFWDHIIRNQEDLNRHIDYIHYNPVKHGYVNTPFDWQHSSIHKYYSEGFYTLDWGLQDEIKIQGQFGE